MAEKIILINPDKKEEVVEPKVEKEQQEDSFAELIKQNTKMEAPKTISLNMRRGLDDRLMIFDHDHIDIVYSAKDNKVMSFAKQDFSDIVYETQHRLFSFLVRKGLCSPEAVQGGNVYASMEAQILKPKDEAILLEHLVVLNLEKWIKSEKPALEMDKEYTERFNDMLTDPTDEDSTELGQVPQQAQKGSIPNYRSRRYIGGNW